MSLLGRRRWLISLTMLVAVGTLAAGLGVSDLAAIQASNKYKQERQKLLVDVGRAQAEGYTAEDLGPITSGLTSLERQSQPLWLITAAQFYGHQADQAAALDAELKARKARLLEQVHADTTQQVNSAKGGIERYRSLRPDDADLNRLQQRFDHVAKAEGGARRLTEYRNADQQALALVNDTSALVTAQQAENTGVAKAADDLKAQTGGNGDAIRKAGNDALANGRNDASVAAYMNKPTAFRGYDALNTLYSKLEKYGRMVGSPDPNTLAQGAAGTQVFAGQIHNALINGLPAKAIIISYERQHLWAYEGSKLVRDTLITTGRPELPTDLGPMKVLKKDSPWKMHSPWPKGSPYWYPDTAVQMVVWFTTTGEGLHDASWQSCCWGPGSQYTNNASHGCIHVPYDSEGFLFNWADRGTPVVVYQGDGSPVSSQVSKISTDDQGAPLTGPKGA